jgi:hypothetical protein
VLPEMTLLEVTCPEVTTGSYVTGSDVIFPRFFLTRVVVQNVPLHEDTKGIIRSVNRMTNNNGTFCTTTLVRKKRGKIMSLPVTSGHVTSSNVISGSTPFPNKLWLQKQQISVAYFCSCTGN